MRVLIVCLPRSSNAGSGVGGCLRFWFRFGLRSLTLLLLPTFGPGLPPFVSPFGAGSIFWMWVLVDVERPPVAALRRVAATVGGLFHRESGGTR